MIRLLIPSPFISATVVKGPHRVGIDMSSNTPNDVNLMCLGMLDSSFDKPLKKDFCGEWGPLDHYVTCSWS